MADQNIDLRRTFDGLVAEHVPSAEQIDVARLRFQTVVQSEQTIDRRTGRAWSVRIAAVAALVVAIAVVSNVLPNVRSTANAFLLEIAEAARVLPDQSTFPEGAYLYTDINNVAGAALENVSTPEGNINFNYILPRRLQGWSQGDFVLSRETVGVPIFFDEVTEQKYYQLELDLVDRVGETYEVAQEGELERTDPDAWSRDSETLLDQLIESVATDQSGYPLDRMVLDAAADLLDPHVVIPPDLRAAVIEVIAGLDIEVSKLSNGDVAASVTYEDEYFGTETFSVTVDDEGFLVQTKLETVSGSVDGVYPAKTTTALIEYERPVFVNEPGKTPGD